MTNILIPWASARDKVPCNKLLNISFSSQKKTTTEHKINICTAF